MGRALETADPRNPRQACPTTAPPRARTIALPWRPSARRWVGGLALTLLLATGHLAPAFAKDELYVANFVGNSITVYNQTASGNVEPIRTISGGNTGLAGPVAVAVDPVHDEIAVANFNNNSITVYKQTADGNVKPLRTIIGAATGLNQPEGVAVDPVHNEIIVTNGGGNTVTVYSRTADGDVTPLRTIGPAGTSGLNAPFGLGLDLVHNEIVVSNSGNNSITVYSRTENGGAAAVPLRIIGPGGTSLLNGPEGLALDLAHDEIVVANFGNDTITVYSRTENGGATATPLRTISGVVNTQLNLPEDIAIDSARNEIFVANFGNDTITVYRRTANGDIAPLRIIGGVDTGLNAEFGLALAAQASIPTLTEWAQLGMVALLLGGGLWTLRRRSFHGLRRRRLGV